MIKGFSLRCRSANCGLTSRKTSKNAWGTMLSVVRDMLLYRSLSAAGSGVGDWSAGLLKFRSCERIVNNESIYTSRAT
jgi:hypothetical protein